MTTRHLAHINPALLVWARSTAGYSVEDAAEKVGISSEKLAQIEAGAAQLSVPQLRAAANVYKRPLATFFLPKAPAEEAAIGDFRRANPAQAPKLSTALRLELRQAEDRRDEAITLSREIGRPVKAFTARADQGENPEDVGQRVRSLLGVTDDQQRSWRNSRKALRFLKQAAANRDVLVFETSSVPLDEMRGFALPHRTFPVIVLNGKDGDGGRVFTLLHEFTHVLLNQSALCDPSQDFSADTASARIEKFCNHVAGAAIAPLPLLQSLAPDDAASNSWTHAILHSLARELGSSKEVVLRRLLIAGRTSQAHYRGMRKEFLAEYDKLRQKQKEAGGAVPPHVLTARNLGAPFIQLALAAYNADRISARSLSETLGTKLSNIDKLEAAIFKGDAA